MSDPVGLSNCLLWLDADDTSTLTLAGQRVASWTSKGLCNLTFTPGGKPYTGTIGAPLYVPTSRAVYFDNGDYQSGGIDPDSAGLQMCNANFPVPTAYTKTVYAVFNILNGTTTGYNQLFFMDNGVSFNYSMYATGPSNNLQYQLIINNGNKLVYSNVVQPYTTSIFTHLFDADSPNEIQSIYLNGSFVNSDPLIVANSNINFVNVALGSGYSNTYTGYLHELLYYNAYHTNAERQQVEAYLTAKWRPSNQLKTYFPLYQYVPIDPIYVNASGKGPVYLFIQPTDLPVGLIYNPLTQDISGKSVRAGAESTTVYAVDDAGTTTLGLNFQTDFPVVKRTFGNAGNYTSYVRQYTLANAAQNARDRFVLAEDTGLGAFTAPYPPDVVTQTVDPKCYSTSNCP
jgi:hypothetical protein